MKTTMVLLLLVVGACANSRAFNRSEQEVRTATTQLELSMPMESVRRILGVPDQEEGSLCGRFKGAAWKCVVWTYSTNSSIGNDLHVLFQPNTDDVTGPFIVNSWYWTF